MLPETSCNKVVLCMFYYKGLGFVFHRRSYAEDRRVCYVTVTPAPGESGGTTAATDLHLPCRVWQRALDVDRDMVAGCSVHFKFDLLPPFPAFIPSLCLRVSGTCTYTLKAASRWICLQLEVQ